MDARYDWLPSPHNLIHKHTRFQIAYYGNACRFKSEWDKRSQTDNKAKTRKTSKKKVSEGHIALVSPGGDCSLFTKVTGWRRTVQTRSSTIKGIVYPTFTPSLNKMQSFSLSFIACCRDKHQNLMRPKDPVENIRQNTSKMFVKLSTNS